MIDGFKVITLCGSTRFKDEFLEAQKQLTLEGNIVISVGLFGHSGDDEVWTDGRKDMLDRMHLAKIDMADEIFVINVGGYIGDSTKREIVYAELKGKSVAYLEKDKPLRIFSTYNPVFLELRKSGKCLDEGWRDSLDNLFEKKLKSNIDEYNSCQGPWPYQWKNINAVVCGILQQRTIISIDVYDLEFLYDADRVVEVRVLGKGTNIEEQCQSILDTVRRDYAQLLLSSKKVVATCCHSSEPATLLLKFFERLQDLLPIDKDLLPGHELNVIKQLRYYTSDQSNTELMELSIICSM